MTLPEEVMVTKALAMQGRMRCPVQLSFHTTHHLLYLPSSGDKDLWCDQHLCITAGITVRWYWRYILYLVARRETATQLHFFCITWISSTTHLHQHSRFFGGRPTMSALIKSFQDIPRAMARSTSLKITLIRPSRTTLLGNHPR